MSEALYTLGGLRFWSGEEIEIREGLREALVEIVTGALTDANPAWAFERIEGPCLTPAAQMSPVYDDSDVFGPPRPPARDETSH